MHFGKDDDCTVQDGLSQLSKVSPAALWKDLSKDAKESLRAIALSFPELVRKVTHPLLRQVLPRRFPLQPQDDSME